MDNKNQESVPAQELWVDEFGDFLFGIAISRVDRPEVAEDLVQETFLRALKGYQAFRGDSQFRTWLSGILSNVISDFFRNQYREGRVFEKSMSDVSDLEIPSLDREQPDQLSERMEVWRALEYCLTQIPNHSAAVFRAVEMDGLSNKEIAVDKDMTENGVAVLLYRARKALRACLKGIFK